MADEEFDLCECIWRNELAMQRLLYILRQTQSYCTDNECLSMSRLPLGTQPPSNFFVTCLIIAFFVIMYAFRAKPFRQLRNDDAKDRNDGQDSSGDPPAPPSTAN